MTIKELKNNILLALYERYKNGDTSSIEFDKLCTANSIIYDSDKQLSDAIESLESHKLVKAVMYINNKGLIQNITPDGVQFVEENLLTDEDLVADGLKDTAQLLKSGASIDVDIDTDSEPDNRSISNVENHTPIAYKTKEINKGIMDSSVPPCFGVTTLAECYIKQLDKIAEHTNDNFCMLGIFGPWGRGKTYFFQQIKHLLEKRTKEDETIKYEIIEFNAWKYQDTPAIWAYLYETIYKEGLNCKSRCFFYIKQLWLKQWLRIISIIAIYGIVWWVYWYISECPDLSERIKSIMQNLRMPLAWLTALSGLFYSIIKNPISIHEAIEKHFKRKSYRGMLGIQNDLEQDLELLIKSVANKPEEKQIILFVDDIDRCETTKILNVVNSLRLILENSEIQKRMIVICSVDPNKFVDAYCSNKFGDGYNYTEEQREEAKKHLDKLFIFGIGLPSLDQTQQIEYLKKLYNPHEVESITQSPFSTNREKHSFIAIPDRKELTELTDNKLGEYLSKYLKENNIVGLTPRTIRIIYYRLLFANNIMASSKSLIKDETLDKIIQLSISDDHSDFEIETAGSDVVGMVVPY